MKKILIVTRSLYKTGGVETALVNMIDEIHKDFEIDLFAFAISNEYIKKLENKVTVIKPNKLVEMLGKEQGYYSKKSVYFYIRAFLVILCKLINNSIPLSFILNTIKIKDKYDIGISYIQAASKKALSDGNNQFVLKYIDSTKKIVFIHSDYERENYNIPYHNELYNQFDKIVTVSESCKNKIIECVPQFKTKTYVVHNFYAYREIKNKSLNFKPNYPTKKLNFVTVSRLSNEKGLLRMVEVFRKLDCSKLIWHIVGAGDLYDKLLNKINEYDLNDVIILHGEQKNPYPYILLSDLLIVCSLYEAAPMVIGEANILGVPVLSTKTLSTTEQISDHYTGYICDNSEKGLLEAMNFILDNPEILAEYKKNLSKLEFNNDIQYNEFLSIIND